jgi:hypothetical protein
MTRSSSCGAIGLALAIIACQQPKLPAATANTGVSDVLASKLLGAYAGQYSKGMIRLFINYISGNTASGYNFHKGLRRNINGQVEQKDGRLLFVLKEPGGNPYDGTFYLTLDTLSQKITGKWVPTDSSKAHAGELNLSRMNDPDKDESEDFIRADWEGDLGHLSFGADGTVDLEYHPNDNESAQLMTVHGNYEHQGDTLRIEWQRNSRTPVLKMKLVQKPYVEGSDSVEFQAPRLEGSGVKFTKVVAG